MNAYVILAIMIAAGVVVIGIVDYLRPGGAFASAGRLGSLWFEHAADQPIEQRPSEDTVDLPIPRRPLRGRID